MKPQVVWVTTSSVEEARKIAVAVLNEKLAACVQIIPGVESHFWWQGTLKGQLEVLLVLKADVGHFQALSEMIRANHSYESPEIIAMVPASVDPAYLQWWSETLE